MVSTLFFCIESFTNALTEENVCDRSLAKRLCERQIFFLYVDIEWQLFLTYSRSCLHFLFVFLAIFSKIHSTYFWTLQAKPNNCGAWLASFSYTYNEIKVFIQKVNFNLLMFILLYCWKYVYIYIYFFSIKYSLLLLFFRVTV